MRPSSGKTALLVLALATVPLTPVLGGVWHDDVPFEHDGLTRYFRYYVPDTLAPDHPVLFVLHGGGGGMRNVMNNGTHAEWPEIADEEGMLLIVPNGINSDTGDTFGDDQNWNDCRGDAGLADTKADDVGFVSALIDWAETEHQPDLQRVYTAGASNGGMMSYRLAFELDDRIAAIASFIANLPAVEDCYRPVSPTPVFICNGDAEEHYMPWDGGCVTANSGCDRGTVISALETRDWWIEFNRADPVSVETIEHPDLDPNDGGIVTSDLYSEGIHGSEVIFYRMGGAGHVPPSIEHPRNPIWLQLMGLGKQNHDVEGAREAWAFLSRHTLDGTPPSGTDPGDSAWLRIEKNGDGTLQFTWTADCGAGTAYGVYRGDLGTGYDSLAPEPGRCDIYGTTASIPEGDGRADFFLVVPNTGSAEGGYGASRNAAAAACFPQAAIDSCAPSH